jgi:hypothetical protein
MAETISNNCPRGCWSEMEPISSLITPFTYSIGYFQDMLVLSYSLFLKIFMISKVASEDGRDRAGNALNDSKPKISGRALGRI